MPDALRDAATPLDPDPDGDAFDAVIDAVGDRRFVLLGEATHGSREFYAARRVITRRLIEDKGFNAVAVEADWPDAYRVNRYIRHQGEDPDADAALGDFERFPRWMWRNREVVKLVETLCALNDGRSIEARVGFYGLDLYSLHRSMEAVVDYLDKVDPDAAAEARRRYGCFETFERDPITYARAAAYRMSDDCEDEVLEQLVALNRRAQDYLNRDGIVAADEYFTAEQNARLAANAERYYRHMIGGRVNTWNLRDSHMADTLFSLAQHLERRTGSPAKVAVWAHNSHLGDARSTSMGRRGEHNLGQLVRERVGDDALLVGFTTHAGTVAAASDWDGPVERKRIVPSLDGSVERLFHDVGEQSFCLDLRRGEIAEALAEPRLERAIGVIYRPETERQSHYFTTRLPQQFDLVLHYDTSAALRPLDDAASWDEDAEHPTPETYPFGV